ncbi:unnamed protein product, partial [Effrenium voratum]
ADLGLHQRLPRGELVHRRELGAGDVCVALGELRSAARGEAGEVCQGQEKLRESDSPLFALNGLLAEKKRRGDSVVLSTCTNSPDVEELATAMGSPSWWA